SEDAGPRDLLGRGRHAPKVVLLEARKKGSAVGEKHLPSTRPCAKSKAVPAADHGQRVRPARPYVRCTFCVEISMDAGGAIGPPLLCGDPRGEVWKAGHANKARHRWIYGRQIRHPRPQGGVC